MIKKVAVIGTVGLPANYGGFETLVEYITAEISTEFDITVYCSSKAYDTQLRSYNNCNLQYINLEANGMQSIFYDIMAISKAIQYADILLILGVSGCISLPLVKKISKKRIIVNIDGLEWKRQKWNALAKIFLKWSEKLAVTYADAVIADNEVIKEHVSKTYNLKAHLIAYGGDHCSPQPLSKDILDRYPFLKDDYAFKVCRIEPENNIEMILETFSKVPKLPLVLVGNWENSDFGANLRQAYQSYSHLHLLDAIYDQTILNKIRSNCWVYIHGHSAGGTNPSLVEAMSLGLPVLAFDVNYNRATTHHQALYFKNSEDLLSLLNRLDPVVLEKLAHLMKRLAVNHYRWQFIAQQYKTILNATIKKYDV